MTGAADTDDGHQHAVEQLVVLQSRKLMIFVSALFVVLLLAAALVPIGGAVIGIGQLGVETRVRHIAHPLGGVISEILVRDGDRVKKGDLLLRLDTAVSGVRADLSGRTVDQLLAQQARLEAEREGRGTIVFPMPLVRRSDDSAVSAMAAEQRLFRLRLVERQGMKAQLGQRVLQFQKQISGYEAQILALQRQQALIEPERQGVQELWEKGLVTISRRNQLERTAADLDGSIASLQASIAQAGARITETREQVIQLDQAARAEAGTEHAQISRAINEQTVAQVSASDAHSRSEIRAPYHGVVDKLTVTSVGDVIQSAQTIMEIVPDNDRLIVEARINPGDIDEVRVGQTARARLTAYAGSATPEIPGRVIFASAERTTERETGASYFRVEVELDREAVTAEKLDLLPGMPVEIFISTGSRSMLSYLTKPLSDQFARAFRD